MSEKQPKKKKTAGDVVLTVVLIAAICVFCYAGYNLFHIYTEYKKGTDEYNSITQMAVTERDPDGEAAGPEAGSELKAPMDIDFASLKSVNNDVVGWIYVEAVPDINYPIVHGKDNETYLHRTYEKNYNFAGTIFVDYENKGDFSDCNTIVYGHNMKNGSMFAQLKKFTQDEETYKKSKYFWIFTPEKNYRYEIISAYTTGVNSDTYTLFKGPGEEFEKYLEIKGNSDHSKLIEMLDTVNDYSIPIDEILNQYFDTENITYWMAYQILTGNVDTQNRNTYIYSPLNSDTWYFISWDNDGSFMRTEYQIRQFADQGSWESGISNYWGNVLFQRCLKSERFREKLDEAILDLKEYLSEERLGTMIEKYKTVVKPYLYEMPDVFYAPLTSEQYDELAASLPEEIEKNYQLYVESLSKPMPFYIGVPVAEGNKMKINWDNSYSFDAEDITYSVEIARDYLFQDVIYIQDGLLIPETELELPEAGQYFIRVRATNEKGKTQDAFDYYVTDEGKQYGMRCIYVTEDGQIEEDIYEE